MGTHGEKGREEQTERVKERMGEQGRARKERESERNGERGRENEAVMLRKEERLRERRKD
jgi:hypothetical protein